MYHICPPQYQIQLARLKQFPPRSCPLIAITPAQALPEFAHPVGAAIRGMNKTGDGARGNGLLDLGETAHDLTGLAGERQSLQAVLRQKCLDLGRQTLRGHDLCLKATGESLPFDGFRHVAGPRRHPNATSRQFSSDVGHDHAAWPNNETNHVLGQTFRPCDDAGPLGRTFRVEECGPGQMIFSYSPVSFSKMSPAARSATASIHPALTRAVMMRDSASSREISKPSRPPACFVVSPSL